MYSLLALIILQITVGVGLMQWVECQPAVGPLLDQWNAKAGGQRDARKSDTEN